MTTRAGSGTAPPLDRDAFEALRRRLADEVSRGPDDRPGALRELTPARLLAAAGEIRTGRTVTLAAPIGTEPTADNPEPCDHRMTSPPESGASPAGLHFALDRFAMNVHGNADSHIDALCHVVYDATLYNGVPATAVTSGGATELSIDAARDGIVGRGVLLDIPRLRGVPWLEPGDQVTAGELAAAEAAQQVRVGEGDLLFVRVGHRRRRNELGPWDVAATRAGLHPEALRFLAERRVAALGSDSNSDAAPSSVPGVGFPVHVLGIHAMGLHLLDYLQFEDLLPFCEQLGRWSFFCVIAPLRLPAATGSPVNPIAVL
ncbi:cyclase family protein [Streptomyces sp. NPDC002055]|uniref:cyclase family protein n=1 Tax=Streptomyces sp. NPDC002055 TaxID=3154534 RepID=UPI00332443E5